MTYVFGGTLNIIQTLSAKATEFGKLMHKRPLRRLRSFKVNDFGTNRKPICDFVSS